MNILEELESSVSKEQRRKTVERFLLEKPTPEELAELTQSELVRHSIDLKYVLERHFREMEYREANEKSESKYDWLYLISLLGSIPSI